MGEAIEMTQLKLKKASVRRMQTNAFAGRGTQDSLRLRTYRQFRS
jgi:hypothetical protein